MQSTAALLLVLAFSPGAPADPSPANWPQFRGPLAAGSSMEKALPLRWDREENAVWKAPVPGSGWSSPVVWGRRIFLTSVVAEGKGEEPRKGLYLGGERPRPPEAVHRWIVLCVDLETGRILWERETHKGAPESPRHLKNTYASETPVTDGERVYAYFGNVGLFAYDMEGKSLWSQKLGSFRTRNGWGTASSPVLHEKRLYIQNDNEDRSYLLAFDAKGGQEIWRRLRDEKSNWSTPFIWENEKRSELVTTGSGAVRSYDLDGKLLWELKGMSSITIPTPTAAFGLLYISSGYILDQERPVYAIRPGASGDISLANKETQNGSIAWSKRQAAPYHPSPLISGDHLYILHDRGFLSCYDARSGKEIYERRRFSEEATAFTVSPWAYGGRVFCLSEDGDTFVVPEGPEFRVERRNSLGEMCMATPAIAGRSLLIRTAGHLYRIEEKPGI